MKFLWENSAQRVHFLKLNFDFLFVFILLLKKNKLFLFKYFHIHAYFSPYGVLSLLSQVTYERFVSHISHKNWLVWSNVLVGLCFAVLYLILQLSSECLVPKTRYPLSIASQIANYS